jgi:arylsulfatase A-like enzyme
MGWTVAADRQEPRPNILVVVTDDQRGGLPVMPAVRKWMRDEGTFYPNAYATTPLCCPSRASIMSGLYAHNHGVQGNPDALSFNPDQTLQAYLSEEGYETALYGKYLNNYPLEADLPHFDRYGYFCCNPKDSPESYIGGEWNIDGEVETVEEYSTSFIGDRTSEFIASATEPWYAYAAPIAPHLPFVPEAKYADVKLRNWPGNPATQETDRSDKPSYGPRTNADLKAGNRHRKAQLRTLMSVDDMVDQLFQTLSDEGQLDNTIVVFMSDNGYMWGEHGLIGKPYPYSQSVDIPMFMRFPESLDPGAVDTRRVANIDVAPTILDAAGIDPLTPMDGRSVLDNDWEREHIFTEFLNPFSETRAPWRSVTTDQAQYIQYYDSEGQVVAQEYYDLESDPWQLENLLGDVDKTNDPSAELVGELASQLAFDGDCAADDCP